MDYVGRSFLETKVSRALVEGGDKNIGFFHKMANVHRRRSSLVIIKINDHWVCGERKIKKGVVQAFQPLSCENGDLAVRG